MTFYRFLSINFDEADCAAQREMLEHFECVDPVLADWCFNRLDGGTRDLALRPISDKTAATRETMRAESSTITRKLIQDISNEIQNVDNNVLTVIVISKCDARI